MGWIAGPLLCSWIRNVVWMSGCPSVWIQPHYIGCNLAFLFDAPALNPVSSSQPITGQPHKRPGPRSCVTSPSQSCSWPFNSRCSARSGLRKWPNGEENGSWPTQFRHLIGQSWKIMVVDCKGSHGSHQSSDIPVCCCGKGQTNKSMNLCLECWHWRELVYVIADSRENFGIWY